MIDELQDGGFIGPERKPCPCVSGWMPWLPPTPPPIGGPVPDRRISRAQINPRPLSQVVDDAEDVV
jgi:hypothetical protein